MAKNKIEIDVVVDDKGTTKKLGLEANSAAAGLDKAAKSSGKLDRNMKGTANISSNTSKNFSKMQQGMGGLVGAYASLAAQLFAVSAAFNFLKSAGDLKVLQAGQKAYAASTGLALRTVAKDIVTATDAQISFREASQAAAIGISSGLSPSQLGRLGTAAKDVSMVLGRDVTDSFNRLVRGVTKAEPELLDELGVVLRLKDATEKYGAAIGKTADQLTPFERSQAVANDVLSQTESKYSAILAATGSSVNAYNQLGKAFDDILMTIMKVVDAIAGPFAKVLTDTPQLGVAAFGLLLSGPLKALGFNLKDVAAEATRSAAVYKRAAAIKAAAAKKVSLTIEEQKVKLKEVAAEAMKGGSSSKILENIAGGGIVTPQAQATMKKAITAAKASVNELGIVTKGVFKGMHITMVTEVDTALAQMELAEKNKATGTQKNVAKMKAAYAGLVATIKGAGAAIATWGTKLLGWLGWIGIAVTAFQMLADAFGLFQEKLSDSEKFMKNNVDRLKEMNEEYATFLQVQAAIAKDAKTGQVVNATGAFGNLGSMMGMLDINQMSASLSLFREYQATIAQQEAWDKLDSMATNTGEALQKYRDKLDELGGRKAVMSESAQAAGDFFQKQLDGINQLREEFGASSKSFDAYEAVLKNANATTADVLNAWSKAMEFAAAVREYPRLAKEAAAATQGWANSMAPLNQAEMTIKSLDSQISALNTIMADSTVGKEERARQQETLNGLKAQRELIDRINTTKFKASIRDLEFTTRQVKESRGLTALLKERLQLGYKIQANKNAQSDNLQEQKNLQDVINTQEGGATDAQNRRLETLRNTLLLLKEQSVELENQTQAYYRLRDAGAQAFEGSLQSNISALIQGTEKSFKDAILNIAKATLTSIADTLSKIMTEKIMGKLFKVQDPADKVKAAHQAGAEVVKQKIKEGHMEGLGGTTTTPVPEGIKKLSEEKSFPGKNAGTGADIKANSLLYGETGTEPKAAVDPKKVSLSSTFDQFTSDMKSLFSGDAPFLDSLGNLFSNLGSNLSGLFGGLMDGIGGLFGGAGGGGGFLSSLGSFFFANGGVAKGGFRAFANGGMVNKPTLGLVGEGKYNEAVVPLPDGNRIPVQMKGMGNGGTNNVTVNVAMDGNQSSSSNSKQGQDLGSIIASAVQKELQNQKRSGGILNPYGAA